MQSDYDQEIETIKDKYRWQMRTAAFGLAVSLYLLPLSRAKGEDHLDYRYEHYEEDGARILVETHSALFEKKIRPWLSLKGEFVYDAISGASPDGRPAPSQVL